MSKTARILPGALCTDPSLRGIHGLESRAFTAWRQLGGARCKGRRRLENEGVGVAGPTALAIAGFSYTQLHLVIKTSRQVCSVRLAMWRIPESFFEICRGEKQ